MKADEPGNLPVHRFAAWSAAAAFALAAMPLSSPAAEPAASSPDATTDVRNWFNDPFFQISHAIDGCPVPMGPYITQTERRVQAHHRAERGTSCWLAGQCTEPNFYRYDEGIAQAIRAALAADNPFADSTLWVTVQGRVVYVEGCVHDTSMPPRIEAYIRKIPNVQTAAAIVRTDASQRIPYRVRSEARP